MVRSCLLVPRSRGAAIPAPPASIPGFAASWHRAAGPLRTARGSMPQCHKSGAGIGWMGHCGIVPRFRDARDRCRDAQNRGIAASWYRAAVPARPGSKPRSPESWHRGTEPRCHDAGPRGIDPGPSGIAARCRASAMPQSRDAGDRSRRDRIRGIAASVAPSEPPLRFQGSLQILTTHKEILIKQEKSSRNHEKS